MTKNKNKQADRLKKAALFSGMAFEMAAIIGLGVWAGWKLDRKFRTDVPWFTVGLGLLGVMIGLYYPISTLIKWQTDKD